MPTTLANTPRLAARGRRRTRHATLRS